MRMYVAILWFGPEGKGGRRAISSYVCALVTGGNCRDESDNSDEDMDGEDDSDDGDGICCGWRWSRGGSAR